MHYADPLLFGALPYVSLFVFFLVTIQRYRSRPFTYSSLSSQFLENRLHFWALIPLHYGILFVLALHLAAFLMPRQILNWNSSPARLYLLEVSGLAFAVLAVIGLIASIVRRLKVAKIGVVTSKRDWVLYGMLLIQVLSGIEIAVGLRWGSSWFAAVASPYLWSIFKFNPRIDLISPLPAIVKLHIVMAYLIIGYFPFTRLVHILVVPNPYLWRKPQIARWYGRPQRTAP